MQNPPRITKINACPYLGLAADPASYLENPSSGNYCHHAKVPASPISLHQEAYCLKSSYFQCPVYKQEKQLPFPQGLQRTDVIPGQEPAKRNRNLAILAAAALVVTVALILTLPFINIGGAALPVATSMVQATSTQVESDATPTLSAIIGPPGLSTSTPDPASSPAPTKTKSPVQRHALEIPVRVDNLVFIIHKSLEGDGFEYLAKTYHTSADVIREINYLLPPAIWVNLPIVVAFGATSVDPLLPSLQAYKVIDEKITIDELAKKLQVSASMLRHYNNCADGCSLVKGDWVIVPHPK